MIHFSQFPRVRVQSKHDDRRQTYTRIRVLFKYIVNVEETASRPQPWLAAAIEESERRRRLADSHDRPPLRRPVLFSHIFFWHDIDNAGERGGRGSIAIQSRIPPGFRRSLDPWVLYLWAEIRACTSSGFRADSDPRSRQFRFRSIR